MSDSRSRVDVADEPVLTGLRLEPPADGVNGLRRKLAHLSARRNSHRFAWDDKFFFELLAMRPARIVGALSLLISALLLVDSIYERPRHDLDTNSTFARALRQQLAIAKNPQPAGVVANGSESTVAFEIETGSKDVRFYWMLTDDGHDSSSTRNDSTETDESGA